MDSEQCVCRHKSLKPKVAIKAESKEATFKAGETMVFWADVKGEPMCEDIVWSLGGKQVRIQSRLQHSCHCTHSTSISFYDVAS